MKFRLAGIDKNDKRHYHLGKGAYSACPDKAKIYEAEDRTFVNDNAYKQTDFHYSLEKKTDFQTSVQRENRMPENVDSVAGGILKETRSISTSLHSH